LPGLFLGCASCCCCSISQELCHNKMR
jgi:hypothetical protein